MEATSAADRPWDRAPQQLWDARTGSPISLFLTLVEFHVIAIAPARPPLSPASTLSRPCPDPSDASAVRAQARGKLLEQA